MQHNHTPLSYSKGLFLGKKIQLYKHLVKKLFPKEDDSTMPTYKEGGTSMVRETEPACSYRGCPLTYNYRVNRRKRASLLLMELFTQVTRLDGGPNSYPILS